MAATLDPSSPPPSASDEIRYLPSGDSLQALALGFQPLLADLMTDEDREVCALAGAALRATLGDRVPFDPQWSKSRRLEAASRLLELHNRRP